MSIDSEKKELNIKELFEVLPHRYPFLLVDKILNIDLDKGTIVGQKNVTFNESFFQGHYPEAPIMPGVLILEALAQTGGILIYMKGEKTRIAVLLSMNHVKFRNPVKPGDILILKGEMIQLGSRGGRIQCTAMVNEKIAAEAEISFCLVHKNQI